MSNYLDKLRKAWDGPLPEGVVPIFREVERFYEEEIPALASKESKLPPPMPSNAEIIDLEIHELPAEKQKVLRSFIKNLILIATRDRDEHQRD